MKCSDLEKLTESELFTVVVIGTRRLNNSVVSIIKEWEDKVKHLNTENRHKELHKKHRNKVRLCK